MFFRLLALIKKQSSVYTVMFKSLLQIVHVVDFRSLADCRRLEYLIERGAGNDRFQS